MLGNGGDEQIIKEVRGILNLGLKESKTLVESVPAMLKENMPKKEAEVMLRCLALCVGSCGEVEGIGC